MLDNYSIHEWIIRQKLEFGSRVKGTKEILYKKLSKFDAEVSGLGGNLLPILLYQDPIMVPKNIFGGDKGWQSKKFRDRWYKSMDQMINGAIGDALGIFIRFLINAPDWVPHPYNPPLFTLNDFKLFSKYIIDNKEIFDLCQIWRNENSNALTKSIQQRLNGSQIIVSANYSCFNSGDHADVAFFIPQENEDALNYKSVWKNQTQLGKLVSNFFPDTCREYSPIWLSGQRLDIYIPSLNVAIEYQGVQHYQVIDYFGGHVGYEKVRERDKRKSEACKAAGVKLIEWGYMESISEKMLRIKLESIGIILPQLKID